MSPTAPTYGSATRLLHSLEDGAVSRRMRVLALYARDHAGTSHLAGILRQLETSGHGRLAVHMATVARDTGTLARHLAGPDHELRRAALRAVRDLPGEAVAPALDDAPTGLRRALYRALFHARRTGAADTLLPRVRAEYGDAEAAALLPACSPGQVVRHLPDLLHAVRSWRRLARRHPDVLLGHLRELGAENGGLPVRLPAWRRALQALDPVRPAGTGALVEELEPRGRRLLHLLPHAQRLPYRDGDRHQYPFRYPALPGGGRSVRELFQQMLHSPPSALSVLRAMPQPMSTAYLDRFVQERSGYGTLALLPYLGLLPRERAEAGARRALAQINVFQGRRARYADPHKDLDAIAHLPYGEAAGPLDDAAAAGDTDRRARGLARLVEATARTGDPRLLARVLAGRAERARAERDPVRRSLLCALASVAPPLLAEASLPALHRLLTDTLRSRDTSAGTRRSLRDLAARLLRHPRTREDADAVEWALEAYTGLVTRFGARGLGERGRPRSRPPWWSGPHRTPASSDSEPTLDQVLPRGAEGELHRRLAPVLDAARARGDFSPVVALARELGRRVHGVPEIREHLAAAVLHHAKTTSDIGTTRASDSAGTGTAGEAAKLYLTGRDARADALALFDADQAAARVPRVWEVLARHHTPSALRAALDAAEHRSADGRAWVPRTDRRVARDWPEPLRARVVDHLAGIADDHSLALDDREDALCELGSLPGTADRIAPYLDGPDTVLREAAVSALGRGDDPGRALDLVLAHADGPRSRAAGPAMSRCARAVAPSRLGPALARALDGPAKVTVRKAAARLLEHHRPPGGIERLVRVLDAGGGQHRDVRAAAAGALMRALDHPAALPALVRHVHGFTEVEVQFALLRVPPQACPPPLRKAAARMVASLPAPSRGHWRFQGWTSRWAPWADHDVDEVVEAVCDLDRDGEQAIQALGALVLAGKGADRIRGILGRLLAAVPGPEHGVPLRRSHRERGDSAHRRVRRVLRLLHGSTAVGGDGARVLEEQRRSVLGLLASRDEYLVEADAVVRRMIGAGIGAAGETHARSLAGLILLTARLMARRPALTWRTERLVRSMVGFRGDRVPLETLEEVVRHVFDTAARTDGAVGETVALVGLRIVERAGTETEWSGAWPELLSRAGDLGHGAVRVEAWRIAVE
ncbi:MULTISPECIES: hypothetical protein [Nocardiopsis]|uniref:Uncharacterized protein n=1 Tax=Nocardiopsis sinuspersici TaxID=501010 RepID=A0A1V3BYS5_9ACTN|nr:MULTISPECIES: hypothetical protein [Nocardiopsis]OOC53409.1 hypothetical protein NOSIN_05965 [Nocardiopsis sinuspersici]